MFIPLKKQYFNQFSTGEKSVEYRLYGTRWNERTCTPGRAVTLSCGYSGPRIAGVIDAFDLALFADIPGMDAVYPDCPADALVACIRIITKVP